MQITSNEQLRLQIISHAPRQVPEVIQLQNGDRFYRCDECYFTYFYI